MARKLKRDFGSGARGDERRPRRRRDQGNVDLSHDVLAGAEAVFETEPRRGDESETNRGDHRHG